jgi:O-antigen/teichoic acid export membrane protein
VSELTGVEGAGVPASPAEQANAAAVGVGRNAVETIAFGAFALLVTLPTTIITSRYLHPGGRGALYLGLVTVAIAGTLIGNIGVAVSHEIKRGSWPTRAIVTQALTISVALGIVGGAVLVPLGAALTPGYRSVALIPIALPAILITGTLTATLVALGRVRLRNLLQLIAPTATLVGVVVLVVLLGKGVTGAVIAWIAAQAAVAVFALVATARIWKPFEIRGVSLELGRRLLLLGLRAGMVNVISLLNYRIELFVLKAYRGVDAVGVYSVSISLAELLWIVPSAFATATIASAVSSSDQHAVAALSQGVRAAIGSTAVFGLALAAAAPFAIPLMFGDRFTGATWPLLILIPGVVAFAPGQLLAVYFSMRLGQMRIPLGVALLSVALTAVLAILLIPPLGLNGAALSTAIGYTVSMLLEAILFSRRAGIGLGELIPRRADFLSYRTFTLGLLRR